MHFKRCSRNINITVGSPSEEPTVKTITRVGDHLRVHNTDGSTYDLELTSGKNKQLNLLNGSGTKTLATVISI